MNRKTILAAGALILFTGTFYAQVTNAQLLSKAELQDEGSGEFGSTSGLALDMQDSLPGGIGSAEKFSPAGMAARKAQLVAKINKIPVAESKDSADPKVVVVDCDKGKSLQDTLDSNDDPLVIEIQGLCFENVTVRRRDGLTIRGTDPLFDGIRGMASDPLPRGVLDIRYSDQIRIENLSMNATPPDGPFAALNVEQSNVIVEDCQIDGNARRGANIRGSSEFQGFGLTLSDNGQDGLGANRSSTAFCTGCWLENNGRWAA